MAFISQIKSQTLLSHARGGKSKLLNKNDLNDGQLVTLNISYGSGVPPSVIAKAMTESIHSTTGKKGQFITDTINNIGKQEKV